MRYLLLILLVVLTPCFSADKVEKVIYPNANELRASFENKITKAARAKLYYYFVISNSSLNDTKKMLYQHNNTMSMDVINTVLTTMKCAKNQNTKFNNILTVIDYSLPSSQKRLWIFDLKTKKLLFHTYVSHGITSGTMASLFFSNKVNSKASSVGVYNTENSYIDRHGLSLRLQGLEYGFNSNASRRYIVMHAAWYVNKDFIKKYGRVGRSWGCPAVPIDLAKSIIHTIKDQSLFVMYYPSNQWFLKSKYLNCENLSLAQNGTNLKTTPSEKLNDNRAEILFADKNDNNRREENEPILVITADNYIRIFNTKAPLKRMLRRQINKTEYIALTNAELKIMDTNNDNTINYDDKDGLKVVYLVIPVVKKRRGYYATEFVFVSLKGQLKAIQLTENKMLLTTKSNIHLRSTTRFIRWLGL